MGLIPKLLGPKEQLVIAIVEPLHDAMVLRFPFGVEMVGHDPLLSISRDNSDIKLLSKSMLSTRCYMTTTA